MPGTMDEEPPSVTLSFANNFWGKDDAGVSPMLERMHNAKVTSDELKAFYAARAALEEEFSRKMLNLSRKPLGSSESGTLKMSFDVIRAEVEATGKAHQSIAQQMKTELEEPLSAFSGGMKERRKIVQNGIEKLLKLKMQQTSIVNKARDRYENDCLKIKGFLAQAHMVMGQEERKNKAKLEKTQINMSETEREYEAAVKVLEETTGRWNRDWKAACDKFQDLEEERIDYTKSSLWNFANIASTVCVSDDASCEKVRLSLEDCDVGKDITYFIQDSGTGQEIPDPPKFINFCRGDAETASLSSEDENYSVAQFPRNMNPAYRANSPQPSMFESHHDPNNPLAREMGLGGNMPIQDQIDVAPRHKPKSQPDPRLVQAQQQAHQQYQQSQFPYNENPMDGMTQFCRMDPTSDRSNVPSPARSPSRESVSDYSNHTSFSSVEPPSGSASPGKPMYNNPNTSSYFNAEPPSASASPGKPMYSNPNTSSYFSGESPGGSASPSKPMQSNTASYFNAEPPNGSASPSKPIYSKPTPFSSAEPAGGAASPSKPMYTSRTSFSNAEPPSGGSASPEKSRPQSPDPPEEMSFQKKRGFFQNSPFSRRKSKHEREPLSIKPSNRNTWAPASRSGQNENASPSRPFGRGSRGAILQNPQRTASPEPVDPRASFQLNIGNNVFDVDSPDKKKAQQSKEAEEDLDPIAQALAELKGVTKDGVNKEGALRVSADRYHGLATPAPPGTPGIASQLPGGAPTPLTSVNLNSAKRGTPPPQYEQPPMSRLGAPQPAHTARQMQKTKQMFIDQKANIFNTGGTASRPSTRGSTRGGPAQEPPRSTSPAPPRATSPRPSLYSGQQQPPQASAYNRSASPNPYAAPLSTSTALARPRANTAGAAQNPYGTPTARGSYSSIRGGSPGYNARAPSPQPASPQPAFAQSSRPNSSSRAAPVPRAASPQPAYAQSNTRPTSRAAPISRAASPQPAFAQNTRPSSSSRAAPVSRAVSPQPAFTQSSTRNARPSSRAAPSQRAASPQSMFRQSYDRPPSSRGNDMALQLVSPASDRGDAGSMYGGSVRSRGGGGGQRPQSSYFGEGGGGGISSQLSTRVRSKSVAEPRQYTRDGRMILHYSRAMYLYNAQIPEELTFAKGDILAVLRLQDDGWWEAEVVGKDGRRGLVPSNYLQNC